jgi:tetratricopeptide (TPR) repeat protein
MNEGEIWNELGNLHSKTGSNQDAIRAYQKAIELDGGFGWSYSNLAVVYVREGHYDEAIGLFRQSLELFESEADKASTLDRLGELYILMSDYDNAVAAYQMADQYRHQTGGRRASIHFERALGPEFASVDLAQSGNSHAHLSLAEVMLQPDLQPLPVEAGTDDPQADAEDETTAPELLDEPVEIDATDELSGQPQPEAELSETDEAVAEEAAPDPQDGVPFEPDPEAETDDADPAECDPEIVGIILGPEDDDLLPIPVIDEEDESVPAQDEPVDEPELEDTAEPRHVEASFMVTRSLTQEDATRQIEIERYKKVIELNPKNPRAWDSLGNLLRVAGRYDEAAEAYQHAISLDPTQSSYHYNLGLVFAALERLEDAIDSLREAVRLNPGFSLAHGTLGGYYRRLGQDDLADEHIEIARSMMEYESEYNRACFAAICGDTDDALDLLKVALENKQTSIEWVYRDPDLDFIRNEPNFQVLLGELSLAV